MGERVLLRSMGAVGVGILVTIPFAVLVAEAVPDCSDCVNRGGDQFWWGALVGWTLGTGIGASMPALDGRCATGTRRIRGLLGAGLASIATVVLSGAPPVVLDEHPAVLVAPLLGGVLGVLTCEFGGSK